MRKETYYEFEIDQVTEPMLLPLPQQRLDWVMEDLSRTKWLFTHQLIALALAANKAYREGEPVLSDEDYDTFFYGEIARRDSDDPILDSNKFF